MKMAKFCACIAAGLVSTLALADAANWYVFFETKGPDKYADGYTVEDGERYALVATKNAEFGGFNANGTAAVEGDKVLTIAPFAKGGRLTPTLFQADAADVDGMTTSVWLLDTRRPDGTVPDIETKVGELVLNGAVEVKDATMSVTTGVASLTGDTGMINPTIEDFAIEGDTAKITVGNVRKGMNYKVQSGLDRAGRIEPSVEPNDDGTITLTVDKDGASFFSVVAE